MIQLQAKIPNGCKGFRLDQAVALIFPQHSRTRIQSWIKHQHLLLNGKPASIKDKVMGGETIEVAAPMPKEVSYAPEPIALDIIFEDEAILILNKPAGLVVHPAAGNLDGTLLNALLNHLPDLEHIPRAGIVHRLDKDTSGIMMVAKSLTSHTFLVDQLQKRAVSREYQALVQGVVTAGGTIDAPIGRHSKVRTKMAVTQIGKPAITHYRIIKKYPHHTHLKVNLETGRTHQIRVHLSHNHFPIIGDKVYQGRPTFNKNCPEPLKQCLTNFPRQALHAKKLTLVHPETQKSCNFSCPLPEDMEKLLDTLNQYEDY